MSVKNVKQRLLWTIRPTSLERQVGRLLRSPEGHDEPPANPSLVNPPEPPPVEPPVPPVEPPVDPNAPKPPEPPKPPEEPPAAVEPLTLENLTLPEGFEAQPELSTKFLEILNGDLSPKDRADALLALHGETLTAASEAGSKAWDDMQTQWKDEVKSDPDIGGAKLQPALTNIGKLLDEFGDDQLKPLFDTTGAGNNVHMIKFLNKIAGVLTEGNFFKAGSPSGNDPDAAAKRMFPSAT
jgi:hypothetical protein